MNRTRAAIAASVLALMAACGPAPEANTVVNLKDQRSSARGGLDPIQVTRARCAIDASEIAVWAFRS